MKVFFAIATVFLSSYLFPDAVNEQETTFEKAAISKEIEENGYFEFENKSFGQTWFSKFYNDFDNLIQFLKKDLNLEKSFSEIDKSFQKSEQYERYGKAPIGLIDEIKSGKSKKIYFHYSKKYHDYIKENYPQILTSNPIVEDFFNRLAAVCDFSNDYFNKTVSAFEEDFPNFRKIMQGKECEFATLVKIVRYDPAEAHASNPHFDFSGLSILMDNSEEENESLLISPYKENIVQSDFKPPKRQFKKSPSTSSALLIPGLALKHFGISLNPTPHAVLQQNKVRYAVIVFAMVPDSNISYDQIKLRQVTLPKLCTNELEK